MKRLMRSLLLAAALTVVLCVSALAADSEPVKGGIYGITGSATLTPDTAATTQTVDGKEYSDYYANAVKFGVAADSLVNDQQYLLLVIKGEGVPTAENIAYIDQAAAQNGSVSFAAYPGALTKGTYHVYLVGADKPFDAAAPAATFQYDQRYTLGDVNGDDNITTTDARLVLQYVVGLAQLEEWQKLAADVNKKDGINVTDARMILQYVIGDIKTFE